METPNKSTQHLPVEIVTEILARLPLRSISRFRSLSRRWKSALESVYFRRLFVSLHQNTSSSWSLVLPGKELIDLHGCETWGLPKSLGSYIQNIEILGKFDYEISSNGLVLMDTHVGVSYVGNPVLQQWVEIPSSPFIYSVPTCLVTRVDEDGVVLSFKVVRTAAVLPSDDESSTDLCYCVYSSETGTWTCKRIHCPRFFRYFFSPMNLNETLYLSTSRSDNIYGPGALVAHDFYGESKLCRVIPLPDHNLKHNREFNRAYTTSSGFVMYIKTFDHNTLKIWKLLINNEDSGWELVRNICLPFIRFNDDISYYAPLAMHPFDTNIVYIWSQRNRYLVSYNLHTQNYKILREDQSIDHLQNCFVNQSACEKYMDANFGPSSDLDYEVNVLSFQSLLPRWIESMPCPPQLQMMDTTSLLSYISSKLKN